MTTITILPEKTDSYRAVAGDKESTGRTAGEALDALTSQLEDEEGGTLVIVQNYKPDRFFNAAQQERLTELMQLREAVDLSPEEESELEGLVEAELDGARLRVEQELQPEEESELERDLAPYELALKRIGRRSQHYLCFELITTFMMANQLSAEELRDLLVRLTLTSGRQEVQNNPAQVSGLDELET
jgi:hypothetical protein